MWIPSTRRLAAGLRCLLATVPLPAQAGFFDGAWATCLTSVFRASTRPDQFQWIANTGMQSRAPSDAQWDAMLRKSPTLARLAPGSVLRLRSYTDLSREAAFDRDGALASQGQRVQALKHDDLDLLEASRLEISPIEVGRVIFGFGPRKIGSSLLAGGKFSIPGELIAAVVAKCTHSLRQQGMGRPDEIEISHTHPYPEVAILEPVSEAGAVGAPLSPADLEQGAAISRAYPDSIVRIRAIVPNGWAYEAEFSRGDRTR